MHTNKMCFIIYFYSPTCFGRFCDHHQCGMKEYNTYIVAQNVQLKLLDVIVNNVLLVQEKKNGYANAS